MIPPSLGAVLRETTLTVSGYRTVAGWALVIPSNGRPERVLLATTARPEVDAYLERHARVVTGRTPGPKARCHGCRVWCPRNQLEDRRLGFDAYCGPCVEVAARRCYARHGRVPGLGEFFCQGCQAIRPVGLLSPLDRDGRRRWRCRPCRKAQVRAADLRRRARRLLSLPRRAHA